MRPICVEAQFAAAHSSRQYPALPAGPLELSRLVCRIAACWFFFLFLSSFLVKIRPKKGPDKPTPSHRRLLDYFLPFSETLILICFGLVSSRLGIRTLNTPLRYSA